MAGQTEVTVNLVRASATETDDTNSPSTVYRTTAANFLEIWTTITAVSGTGPQIVFGIETSIDGTNFNEIGQITATATGTFHIAFDRGDFALGDRVRITWAITGTTPSFTFNLNMVIKE